MISEIVDFPYNAGGIKTCVTFDIINVIATTISKRIL